MAETTKNSNNILNELFNASIYEERKKNTTTEITSCKLLEIDDWTFITTKELQKRIADGAVVNWIDGYDIGPSPLTNALQQCASSEIIAILVANAADINAPTVLPDGTKMTPLEIVRSQEPTHDNMQKELILLRAGATDDIWKWLRNSEKYPVTYWKDIRHLGLWCGFNNEYAYRVFEPIPIVPTEFTTPQYIVECAGRIAWADDTMADPWDIYDKIASYGDIGSNKAIVQNELGEKFAEQFLRKVEKLSFNVAMYQYYTYLGSLYLFCDEKRERINAAQKDLRKHFSYNDWTELMYVTPNATARAEYNEIRKAKFPEIYEWFHMDD